MEETMIDAGGETTEFIEPTETYEGTEELTSKYELDVETSCVPISTEDAGASRFPFVGELVRPLQSGFSVQ